MSANIIGETQQRFLREILEKVPLERVSELHLFAPIRQGGTETGLAVFATWPEAAGEAAEPDGEQITEVVAAADAEVVDPTASAPDDSTAPEPDVEGSEIDESPEDSVSQDERTDDSAERARSADEAPAALADSESKDTAAALGANDEASSSASEPGEPEGELPHDKSEAVGIHADRRSDDVVRDAVAGETAAGGGEPDAGEPDAGTPGDIAAESDDLDAADTQPATQVTSAEPARVRHVVYTARYRLILKGPDRGKWEFDFRDEAEAPLVTVDAVVRGVQRRVGDIAEVERMTPEQLAIAVSDTPWKTAS